MGESVAQRIMKLFSFLLVGKLQKYKAIQAKQLAQAMVNVAKNNTEGIFTYQYNEIMTLANPTQANDLATA